MTKCMLIDATHPEETRVVVVSGTHLEELDVETSIKKQLKGNIYLARLVRVEPSLQAAFVDYGGSRHGFLAFNEIHPDYYQISSPDRQRLLAEQEGAEAIQIATQEENVLHSSDVTIDPVSHVDDDDDDDDAQVITRLVRDYKIQEVIKRRQIMLVQVVKEERGTKGAALTTYLSLAGRYCVLMPNATRSGGGVSRKITSITDRRRLKAMLIELNLPHGMAVILRTAGAERGKSEIRRDYEYLERTWNQVRAVTIRSCAPTLVYEEANLIKRAIRDLYTRDIDEIIVAGEGGYHLAKDFMKMLTPSHAKKVKRYKEEIPLFHRYKIAAQFDAMHNPAVQLRSGGYVVFNQTEALVAIDVNSGKATRERHIEETALKTNLEAAEEIARQLRLRDLAGLIVIDFIDMEENRNNVIVEKRLKEVIRDDRARIQIGRISPFGLLELSRQRLRPSLMETSFQTCPHCNGMGLLRSVESSAMHVLRGIEEEGIRHRSLEISVSCATTVALYILNYKRQALAAIENRYGFHVLVFSDTHLIPPTYRVERVREWQAAEDSEVTEPAAHDSLTETANSEEEKIILPSTIERMDVANSHNINNTASVINEGEESNSDGTNLLVDEGENLRRRRRRRRRRNNRRGVGDDSLIVVEEGRDLLELEGVPNSENVLDSGNTNNENSTPYDVSPLTEGKSDDDENSVPLHSEWNDGESGVRRRRGRRSGSHRHQRTTVDDKLANAVEEYSDEHEGKVPVTNRKATTPPQEAVVIYQTKSSSTASIQTADPITHKEPLTTDSDSLSYTQGDTTADTLDDQEKEVSSRKTDNNTNQPITADPLVRRTGWWIR